MNIEINYKVICNSECNSCGYCFFCHLEDEELIGVVSEIDKDKRIHVLFGKKKWIFYNGEKKYISAIN